MNIGQLRERLNELEREWTAQDVEVMGPFEHQEVCVPVFDQINHLPYFTYRGFGRNLTVTWDITGLGLVIDHG